MSATYQHYSGVVEHYARYRPSYPPALGPWLRAHCGLAPGQLVADIGSGTGLVAERLLAEGQRVLAVEPNAEMRSAAEHRLGRHPGFTSVAATAEATTLPDRCAHLLIVGNAFHWFNHERARVEFERVLVPGGWVVLLWNLELNDGSPFGAAWEAFWQTHIDPNARFAPGRPRPAYLDAFFRPHVVHTAHLPNQQVCDLAALRGLALSHLKAPGPDDPRQPAFLAALETLFHTHQSDGVVTVKYDTAIVYGRLTEAPPPAAAGYTIRPARADDLPHLPAIEHAATELFRGTAYTALAGDTGPDLEAYQHWHRTGAIWVAVDPHEQVVGFAVAERLDGEGFLTEIDVLPAHGRRGLGRWLIAAAQAWARARGCTALRLSTFDDIAWNAPYYAALGFQPLATDALGPELRAVRADEAEAGLRVEHRVFMTLALDPPLTGVIPEAQP